jgi:hypothetical protein
MSPSQLLSYTLENSGENDDYAAADDDRVQIEIIGV